MGEEDDKRGEEDCHAECNEASRPVREILRFAQDDKGGEDDTRGGSSG